MKPATPYSFGITLAPPFSRAEAEVRAALQGEKFGVISEVDIQEKLKEKLGVDHPPHKILGACNPALAYQALQENADVALALPCNVVLRETKDGIVVTALLPSVALAPFEGRNVRTTAEAAEAALKRVFETLSAAA